MNQWNFYTAKELKPEGWIRRQLEIQAEGLSGNLDKVWRDVRDSSWIGGDAEGWERVPYWLDGFIPLAYLLENEDMIARAKRYIDAILAAQQPSGWICPCEAEKIPSYDSWAVQLISKVLVVYYECSGDERIPDVVYRVLKNYYDLLSAGTIALFGWGKFRWFETFVAIRFLAERYDAPWIAGLAEILKAQGADYGQFTERWKRPLNKWTLETHIVNLAMMLKSEALSADLLGETYTDAAEQLVTVLREYNGTPVGLFTGDECLSGLSPIQGTELCAVAEQMYSYEWLYAHTGDKKWAERLEVLAFNALPATISDDMWAHQYLQMSNQIACEKFPGRSLFRTNDSEAHLFGLEPNYGCCTANFNQAWPKFALSAFLHRDDTVLSAVGIPSSLKTDDISVTLRTNYPFENQLSYTASAKKEMQLKVRIPSFAKNLTVNGQPTAAAEELTFAIPAGETVRIDIAFETVPELVARPHDLKSVKCGSLVFALPVAYEKKMHEYEKNGVERKFPYCDFEYIPKSAWNYALSSPFFTVEHRGVSEIPFHSEKPPVVIRAQVRRIAWGLEDGFESVCAKVPESRTPIGDAEEIALYPYGCAKLRMTELPLI
ncbi:MAG: hypothetical protein E7632_03925 [Ruminococcaceae bacterium]|nr:hypothetical protein [Oscillospiraceae bacterium]